MNKNPIDRQVASGDEDRTVPSELATGARELGLRLTDGQLAAFARYSRELVDWNQRMNLTAIVEPREIEIRHFLDSLTAVSALPPEPPSGPGAVTMLDVGAGAGLPGIPLAIVRPDLHVTLLEATQKKCRFLDHVRETLPLPHVTVICGRAEDLAREPKLRASFDVVIARAVAPLATLAELCLPFVRIGGRMIAFKKMGITDEINAASRAVDALGGRLARPILVRVPILNEERQLIVVDKLKATPPAYPRRSGFPAKSPL